jgi:hypothetical protein
VVPGLDAHGPFHVTRSPILKQQANQIINAVLRLEKDSLWGAAHSKPEAWVF